MTLIARPMSPLSMGTAAHPLARIRVSNMSKERPRGPDFLVIGAQRAGTTWIHRVLRQHPALWLPPVKELKYFSNLSRKRTWLDANERRRVKLKNLEAFDLWHLRYLLGVRSDAWYARLFHEAQQRGLIAGEVAPSYAVLDHDTFHRIHQMNDQIRLIFVMRDPVERCWSTATNAYRKGRFSELNLEQSLAWAKSKKVTARSSYLRTIERVSAVFPRHQLFCGFFDDLRDHPEQFVAELLKFLEVRPDDVGKIVLPEAVNTTGGSRQMPMEFAREMAKHYLPVVRKLSRHFDGAPRQWCARYEELLSDVTP